MRAPCQHCERRTVRPNCHAACAAYKQFAAERERARRRKAEAGVAAGARAEGLERRTGKKWER